MQRSLSDLLAAAGLAVPDPTPAEPEVAPAAEAEPEAYGPKVVVRFTKKGRGGKKVTVVSGVVSGHAAILTRLRRELSVGGTLDEGELILQGEQVERVARWLESRGARQVVRAK